MLSLLVLSPVGCMPISPGVDAVHSLSAWSTFPPGVFSLLLLLPDSCLSSNVISSTGPFPADCDRAPWGLGALALMVTASFVQRAAVG